jgi:hypothetical protein
MAEQKFYCYITQSTLTDSNIIQEETVKMWQKKLKLATPNLSKAQQKIINRYGVKTINNYIELILESFEKGTIDQINKNYEDTKKKETEQEIEKEKIKLANKIKNSIQKFEDNIRIKMLEDEDKKNAYKLYLNFKIDDMKEFKINPEKSEETREYIEQIREYVDDFILKGFMFGIYVNDELAGFAIIDINKRLVIDSSNGEKVDTYYIQEIGVDSKYRSKKELKLGNKLFEYCVIRCPKNRSYISIMTTEENIPMIKIATNNKFDKQIVKSGDQKNPLLMIRNWDKSERTVKYDITFSRTNSNYKL